MKPLVSCIIPAHNAERFVKESIESVLDQTYQPLELILIDDGSSDGTREIAERFGDRLRYLHQENRGPSSARNTGIREAGGELIAFNDSDDLWAPDKLALQVAAFEDDEELGICVTHVQNFWEAEMAEEERNFQGHPRSKPMPGYVTQALMARKSVYDLVGLHDETRNHSDDTDWFLRANQAGVKKRLLPDVLVRRRLHKGNRSRQHAARSRDEFLEMVKANLDRKRASAKPAAED